MKMHSKQLDDLMSSPLPNKTSQKRLSYRPSVKEVYKIYDLLNHIIFKNKLSRPEILLGQRRQCWGYCRGYVKERYTGSRCVICLSDKWFCIQWMIVTLAHEMAHQYQWDIISKKRSKLGKEDLMSHGPTFFQHRDRFYKFKLPLKTAHRMRKWFKYQDLHRC